MLECFRVLLANRGSAQFRGLFAGGILMMDRPSSKWVLLKESSQYLLTILLTGGIIGFLVSVVCSIFVKAVQAIGSFRASNDTIFPTVPGTSLSISPIIYLVFAVLLLMGIRRAFKINRWHGPADSIYAAHRTDNELDLRSGFGSTLAAFVSIGGGAPVGLYGPLVHFGATIGSYFNEISVNKKISLDVFIGCGVAAAIAAGFHAPIAGIVFAHEAILRHFSFRAIAPIAVASITSSWFSSWMFGGQPILKVSFVSVDLLPLVPALLISGMFFALIAIIYMELLFFSGKMASSSRLSPLKLGLIAAFVCGSIGIFVPETLGLGTDTITKVLENGHFIGFLLLLLVLKLLMTSLSIGFGVFGGVFAPALFIGASAGSLIGQVLALLGVTSAPQLLAVAGMAAVAAAVVGAPISVVLIVLELTTSYEFAVAAMLSVVVATLFSSLLYGHSFFDAQLMKRGIDVSQGRGNLELMNADITSVISNEFVRLPAKSSVGLAMQTMGAAKSSEAYCFGENGAFEGKCELHQLIGANVAEELSSYIDRKPVHLNHDASIFQAMEIASDFVGETIPVIRNDDQKFVGVVSEGNIFEAYLETQNRIRDLEHG